MSNRNSKAGHIPLRTCVVCRQKKEKEDLIRFGVLNNEIIYDLNGKLEGRGNYVCDRNECLEKISKWKSRHIDKRNKGK